MTRNAFWFLVLAAALGLLGSFAPARQDKLNQKSDIEVLPSSLPKPATVKVEKGTIKVEIPLKGVVEAEQMTELALKPEAWTSPMTVKKAVEHGTSVKKGDVLVEIDTEKLDQAIRDLRLERDLADLAIRQAQEEWPILEKSLPLDLAQTELAKKQADEDLKRFLDVDRPLMESDAEQMVKSSTFYLESAREELKQLQKMYRDKDLTEETEEIILKRQRHQVEMAEHMLKSSKIRREQTLKIQLPRSEQRMRDNAEKLALSLEKAKNTMRLTLNQKRLALEKLRYEHDKSGDRLKNLERDREMLTVRAPVDGTVYFGKCVHGQWSTISMAAAKLQPGGSLTPSDVFMTIVADKPLFVRATVEEKELHLLRQGLEGKVVPVGYPQRKLSARLVKVSAVPQSAGSFDARVSIEPGKEAPRLMPGMACNVKLVAYRKDGVLTVPVTAVFTEEEDEDVYYVYVPGKKNGASQKRTVKLGKTAGKKVEIVEGLREGEEILASKPEGSSSTPKTVKPAAQEN
jgi:multidrug efflux pump subunit AcrA (membrane-fusion protein)